MAKPLLESDYGPPALRDRILRWQAGLESLGGERIGRAWLQALTRGRNGVGDENFHVLVIDLHRALNPFGPTEPDQPQCQWRLARCRAPAWLTVANEACDRLPCNGVANSPTVTGGY